MGVSHSTGRLLAPATFAFDFAAQQYGLLSTPNMKDVHDAHLSFWSPQPYFIGAFFFPQQLAQLAWLYRLWTINPAGAATEKERERLEAERAAMLDFVPYYAVGNVCIGAWMFFWNSANMKTANVFVTINSLTQLYYTLVRLPALARARSGRRDLAATTNPTVATVASNPSLLTNVVATTFAGIGVLDLVHNGSVAYFEGVLEPSTLIKAVTAALFGGLALAGDSVFGSCLVYDLIALTVGQRIYSGPGWSNLLGVYAAGTAAIVGAKVFMLQ